MSDASGLVQLTYALYSRRDCEATPMFLSIVGDVREKFPTYMVSSGEITQDCVPLALLPTPPDATVPVHVLESGEKYVVVKRLIVEIATKDEVGQPLPGVLEKLKEVMDAEIPNNWALLSMKMIITVFNREAPTI